MDNQSEEKLRFKIILVGDPDVNIKSFHERIFKSEHAQKLGVNPHSEYIMGYGAGFSIYLDIPFRETSIQLQIWYFEGNPRMDQLRRGYFLGASGVFLLYDISRRETIESFSDWKELVLSHKVYDPLFYVFRDNASSTDKGLKENLKNVETQIRELQFEDHFYIKEMSDKEIHDLLEKIAVELASRPEPKLN